MIEKMREIAAEEAKNEVNEFSIRVLGYDRADSTPATPRPRDVLRWAADQQMKEELDKARGKARRESRQKTLGSIALMVVSSIVGLLITSFWSKLAAFVGLPIP